MEVLPVGKIPPSLLAELLAGLDDDPRVLKGPAVGEDAAIVLPPEGQYLVVTADPITFATDRLPQYALAVNANDIYVTGGIPRFFTAICLFPAGVTDEDVREFFKQLIRSARTVGCVIVGGHTEVVEGISSPLVSGQMLGFVEPARLVDNTNARPGDLLVLAGPVAIEGTAIMARAAPGLCSEVLGAAGREEAVGLLDEPGICVGPAARVVFDVIKPRACHDPTDGGLLAAVWELGKAAGCGARLVRRSVPVLPACRRLCEAFDLDPLGLIASGSLLCAVARGDAPKLLEALQREEIPSAVIGELLPEEEGFLLVEDETERPFPETFQDEIVSFYEKIASEESDLGEE